MNIIKKTIFILALAWLLSACDGNEKQVFSDLDSEIVSILDSCSDKDDCYKRLNEIEVTNEYMKDYINNIAAVYKAPLNE